MQMRDELRNLITSITQDTKGVLNTWSVVTAYHHNETFLLGIEVGDGDWKWVVEQVLSEKNLRGQFVTQRLDRNEFFCDKIINAFLCWMAGVNDEKIREWDWTRL